MDQPNEPVGPARPVPPADGDIGDPVAVRGFLTAAFIIVLGMILWVWAMIGY